MKITKADTRTLEKLRGKAKALAKAQDVLVKRAMEITGETDEGVVALMESKGWKVQNATQDQNMKEHFDYIISKGEISLKVEVKAEKRLSSKDESTQSEFIWIEILNVQGNNGWIHGKADYIAFQRN